MKHNIFYRVFYFYYDGFRCMTIGKRLWIIIFIKLFVMFAVLRLFFFQDFLDSKFQSDQDKSDYVINEITNRNIHGNH